MEDSGWADCRLSIEDQRVDRGSLGEAPNYRKLPEDRQSSHGQAVSFSLEVKMVKTTSVFPKVYYHGLLVQVQARLDILALVRFDDRLSIVPAEDLKEVPSEVAAAASAGASAAVSWQRS